MKSYTYAIGTIAKNVITQKIMIPTATIRGRMYGLLGSYRYGGGGRSQHSIDRHRS